MPGSCILIALITDEVITELECKKLYCDMFAKIQEAREVFILVDLPLVRFILYLFQ
jgi:hypothetical protein